LSAFGIEKNLKELCSYLPAIDWKISAPACSEPQGLVDSGNRRNVHPAGANASCHILGVHIGRKDQKLEFTLTSSKGDILGWVFHICDIN
jgi:hypothetical protein